MNGCEVEVEMGVEDMFTTNDRVLCRRLSEVFPVAITMAAPIPGQALMGPPLLPHGWTEHVGKSRPAFYRSFTNTSEHRARRSAVLL